MNQEKLYAATKGNKVYKRHVIVKLIWVVFLFLILLLSVSYSLLYVINNEGNFTITLDPNLNANKQIVMSATHDFKETPLRLEAGALPYMDNITESWLPLNIATDFEGEHNGNNYIAYTFFVKNNGDTKTNYIMSLDITSVIKNVDEAIRILLYQNIENKEIYAKKNLKTGEAEEGTIPFYSGDMVFLKRINDIAPNQVDRYTVVIFLEGNDPECVDSILGGEMKMILSLGEDKKE